MENRILVNKRRLKLGLGSIEEQIELMRARVYKEGQRPPEDPTLYQAEYALWRKKVGWIN